MKSFDIPEKQTQRKSKKKDKRTEKEPNSSLIQKQQKNDNPFKITKKQKDLIIKQLCMEYNCSWAIVSTMLFKEHGIDLSDNAIRTRFSCYLNPTIKEPMYTLEEQFGILKMYFIQGKGYIDIIKKYGDRRRNLLRATLQNHIRRGIRRLYNFLEIKIPYQQLFIDGYLKKQLIIQKLKAERSVQFDSHKYSLSILYCFMVFNNDELKTIPRILGELLNQRLDQMAMQKYKGLKKTNPSLYPKLYSSKESVKRQITRKLVQKRLQSKAIKDMISRFRQENHSKKNIKKEEVRIKLEKQMFNSSNKKSGKKVKNIDPVNAQDQGQESHFQFDFDVRKLNVADDEDQSEVQDYSQDEIKKEAQILHKDDNNLYFEDSAQNDDYAIKLQ